MCQDSMERRQHSMLARHPKTWVGVCKPRAFTSMAVGVHAAECHWTNDNGIGGQTGKAKPGT